jgi:hypothetical protein
MTQGTQRAMKRRLADWEPWKAMAVAAGAGATFTLVVVGVLTALLAWLK